jgi:hypothetical protein
MAATARPKGLDAQAFALETESPKYAKHPPKSQKRVPATRSRGRFAGDSREAAYLGHTWDRSMLHWSTALVKVGADVARRHSGGDIHGGTGPG